MEGGPFCCLFLVPPNSHRHRYLPPLGFLSAGYSFIDDACDDEQCTAAVASHITGLSPAPERHAPAVGRATMPPPE